MKGAVCAWDASGPAGAPALVLIHSLGTDRTLWAPLLDGVRDYRVVRVELPGHGRSPVPDGPCSLEQIAEAVLAAVDEAGVERFHCCGVSLGGMVSLWLSAYRAERVLSLIAANTGVRIGSAELWRERIRAVETGGLAAVKEGVVARWLAPLFVERAKDRVEELLQVFVRTPPAGYNACCAALAEADLGADLARIRAPTLVVAGALDPATPVADSERLHREIRGSRLVILEGASHLSILDAADAFRSSVTAFLHGSSVEP
jgi:3-oxoadipate enol-lactonase